MPNFKYVLCYSYTAFLDEVFQEFKSHIYLTLEHEITESDIEHKLDELSSSLEQDCELISLCRIAAN